MFVLVSLSSIIGESVDSLCRDATDAPIVLNASKPSNALILRLFGWLTVFLDWSFIHKLPQRR